MENASFYALSDRRKGLRAKGSPKSLDLLDETNWFEKNSADLFGKRIQKSHAKIVFYVRNLSYISRTLQKRLRAFIQVLPKSLKRRSKRRNFYCNLSILIFV